MEFQRECSPGFKAAVNSLGILEGLILSRYKSPRPNLEAQEDALSLITARLGLHIVGCAMENQHPEDLEIESNFKIIYQNLLSQALSGNWQGVKKYCQREARTSFQEAAFKAGRGLKSSDEDEGMAWINLARSL